MQRDEAFQNIRVKKWRYKLLVYIFVPVVFLFFFIAGRPKLVNCLALSCCSLSDSSICPWNREKAIGGKRQKNIETSCKDSWNNRIEWLSRSALPFLVHQNL